MAVIGTITLLLTHAATPFASSEPEQGTISGLATVGTDTNASGGSYVQFNAASGPMLGALAPTDINSSLAANGFKEVVISTSWSTVEPSADTFSTSAISSLQTQINNARAAGLSPSLDIGVQYAPTWIFSVDSGSGTRFVDQDGDVFGQTVDATPGNIVANAVTNTDVRAKLGAYISYLGSHLTGVDSVRLGGAAYNELRYPSASSGASGNAFWFYDASSLATLPSDINSPTKWQPGQGTAAQATEFLTAYTNALTNYGVWLAQTGESSFGSAKIEILMPGWGIRPGQITTAENGLLANTPDEVNQGLDWATMLPKLPTDNRIVAYSTYADATQGSVSNPNPAAFIHSILPTGVLAGGESTGNGQTTTTGMNLMFSDAKQWNWYVVNWFFNGQSQTLSQLQTAFNSD